MNGRRLHLDAVVDVSTCLSAREEGAKSSRRYKYEEAKQIARLSQVRSFL